MTPTKRKRRVRTVRLEYASGELWAKLKGSERVIRGPLSMRLIDYGAVHGNRWRLRFYDTLTRDMRRLGWTSKVFIATGVHGGVVVMPYRRSADHYNADGTPIVASVSVCEYFAKLLDLEPGRSRFFTVHPEPAA